MGGVRIDWHIRQLRDDAESHSDKVYEIMQNQQQQELLLLLILLPMKVKSKRILLILDCTN